MPIYEYSCETCGNEYETVAKHESRPATLPCECGGRAELHISSPVVQTLSTHMMGARGMRVGGDGSYIDPNIVNPQTGKPEVITSLSQKRALMKKYGLRQIEEKSDFVREADKRKQTKPLWFS